jgi:RimJ/RimL family protein N-acetyltransferase
MTRTQEAARPARLNIWVNCNRYFVRTIKREDASERWAGWLADPWAMQVMNAPGRSLSKRDIADYIKGFDQRTRILLGIFEKRTLVHVGIIRADLDHRANEGLVNLLIGEPEYRGRGAMSDAAIGIIDYAFETLKLNRLTASTLARNEFIVRYLVRAGWALAPADRQQVRSASGGAMLDLRAFSLTSEAWRAWKAGPVGRRVLRSLART